MGRRRALGEITQKDKDQIDVLDVAMRVIETMTVDSLLNCRDYALSMKIREDIFQLRVNLKINSSDSLYWNWWNQIDRSTLSIVGNIAESIGRGRGHAISACLIARGEAFETLSLSQGKGGPPEASILEPSTRDLIKAIDERLMDICRKMKAEIEAKYTAETQSREDDTLPPTG